jgi:hypothetical protein
VAQKVRCIGPNGSSPYPLSPPQPSEQNIVLTNLNPRPHTNIRKALHRTLRIIPAKLRNRLRYILLTTHSLHITRFAVAVDGAKKAARRRCRDERRKGEEGGGEDGTSEHVCGWLGWLVGGVVRVWIGRRSVWWVW